MVKIESTRPSHIAHAGGQIKPKCWIFDPPYNIGYKYGAVKDDLPWAEYESIIYLSAMNMFNQTDEGHLWMINYPEQTARLLPSLENAGWRFHQWITWTYPSNIGHSKKRFTTASRVVLWMQKGNPDFDVRATVQPYKNPNDRRIKKLMEAGHAGVAHYDHWLINLRKNVSKGYSGWANQLPEELVRRIIQTSTVEGEVVGDLMAGSGTTAFVALDLERGYWINDLDPEAVCHWPSSKIGA